MNKLDEPPATSPVDDFRSGEFVDYSKIAKLTAMEACKEAEQRPSQLQDLAEKTKHAREALFQAIAGIGEALELFRPKSDEYVREVRMFKIAAVAELSTALKQFEDVRRFFLSEKHEQEIERIREFVELCERLNKLKQNGFLDAVADTILRMEIQPTK